MAFLDVRTWTEKPWFSTGGTRAKKYIQSPDDKYYYFKRSQYKQPTDKKPEKDYKYEFWGEIIAYEVGTLLGFNVLKYEIGYDGVNIGCISESMIDSEKEQLTEGIKFLQADNPEYKPDNKDHRKLYTFQAIEKALYRFRFNRFKKDIVEIIVFDALIGNGDRHQENWAVIMEHSAVMKAISNLEQFLTIGNKEFTDEEVYDFNLVRFAPIYDSGSSLGRELTDNRVNELLASNEQLIKYISRGPSEIHWIDKKLSHFDLVKNLLNSTYRETTLKVINRVVDKFDPEAIDHTIRRIDIWIPEFVQQFKIPPGRKELITKIIITRFEKLKELINA